MTYYATSRWGDSEDEPNEERLRELLAELDVDDIEHADVSLTHESEWTLAVYPGGILVWENLEADSPPRHMENVSREKTLRLWQFLAAGDVATIEREPGKEGYGAPMSDEERERLKKEAAARSLQEARDFYDSLGPERADVPCRQPGCDRGAIECSPFCRAHHWESLRNTPCPF